MRHAARIPLVTLSCGLRTPPAFSSALPNTNPRALQQVVVVDEAQAEREFSHGEENDFFNSHIPFLIAAIHVNYINDK